jgi:hypothetical protein
VERSWWDDTVVDTIQVRLPDYYDHLGDPGRQLGAISPLRSPAFEVAATHPIKVGDKWASVCKSDMMPRKTPDRRRWCISCRNHVLANASRTKDAPSLTALQVAF